MASIADAAPVLLATEPDPEAVTLGIAPLGVLAPDAAEPPEGAAEGRAESVTPAALQRSRETWVISVVLVSYPS